MTTEQFVEYCTENGLTGPYVLIDEDHHSFYCQSAVARMTSFLMSRFTQWNDVFDSEGNWSGYKFRLSKADSDNPAITGKYKIA